VCLNQFLCVCVLWSKIMCQQLVSDLRCSSYPRRKARDQRLLCSQDQEWLETKNERGEKQTTIISEREPSNAVKGVSVESCWVGQDEIGSINKIINCNSNQKQLWETKFLIAKHVSDRTNLCWVFFDQQQSRRNGVAKSGVWLLYLSSMSFSHGWIRNSTVFLPRQG
jgi:hypothetical protein